MPHADLHVHTTRSDGALELDAVPAAARRAGVAVVGLTDHERLQPLSAPVVERDGIVLVAGIELRVELDSGSRIDLLGYGVSPTAELEELVEDVQENRIARGQAIVDCVEDRLGIDLAAEVGVGFGRPHVARAIADHPDTDYDYEGAFEHLIGARCPCYVPREVPTARRGRDTLSAACSLVSLAHPLRYADPEEPLTFAAALDAVERAYPYGREVDDGPVARAIARHGLLVTGGSDAHDDRLGLAGLSREEYDALPLPAP